MPVTVEDPDVSVVWIAVLEVENLPVEEEIVGELVDETEEPIVEVPEFDVKTIVVDSEVSVEEGVITV